jgi:hypothetical protein
LIHFDLPFFLVGFSFPLSKYVLEEGDDTMMLNPDCVRDVLLTIEDIVDFDTEFEYNAGDSYERLNKYTDKEIRYHINQCDRSGYLIDVSHYSDLQITVGDLQPKDHEFLANIRNDTIWKRTKSKANEVGSLSLTTLATIAANVISSILKEQF